MKKTYKVFSIIGVSLLVIGGLLTVLGLAFGAHHSVSFGPSGIIIDGGKMIEEEKEFEHIESLVLDTDITNVRFIEADHYKIEYGYHEKRDSFDIHEENGVVTIKNKSKHRLSFFNFSLFGIKSENINYVNIYYPKDSVMNSIQVKANIGDLKIDRLTAKELTIKSDIGDAVIENSNLENVDIDLHLGKLEINSTTLLNSDLDLDLGNLKLQNVTSTDLVISLSMGDADITGSFMGTTNINNSMGNVDFTTDLKEEVYRYELSTSMGNTSINHSKVSSHASKRDGEHSLTIKNSMGDIDVNFMR